MYKSAIILAAFISTGVPASTASEMIFHCRALNTSFEIQANSPWRAYSEAYAILVGKGWPNHPQTLRAISCRLHRA
ncbi:hypothetical protein A33O_02079 [Nitratireductor aquibiodomus RA22]|uniref:Uncharacterized protein n=2 Tax=Nitratireductor aquibiodomus TaxID=204799 RepID=A0A1H4JZY8_9HYPH|nr:hypothetical protein A33O_02079 [Nitratireductor aquibiodomus RA22]SEB51192.1 hypothetical protein SAMN05216452_1796 [Nitratireductor aquibiodomus]